MAVSGGQAEGVCVRYGVIESFYLNLYLIYVNRGPGVCEYGTGLFKVEILKPYMI